VARLAIAVSGPGTLRQGLIRAIFRGPARKRQQGKSKTPYPRQFVPRDWVMLPPQDSKTCRLLRVVAAVKCRAQYCTPARILPDPHRREDVPPPCKAYHKHARGTQVDSDPLPAEEVYVCVCGLQWWCPPTFPTIVRPRQLLASSHRLSEKTPHSAGFRAAARLRDEASFNQLKAQLAQPE